MAMTRFKNRDAIFQMLIFPDADFQMLISNPMNDFRLLYNIMLDRLYINTAVSFACDQLF